jgi:hypothetical protein
MLTWPVNGNDKLPCGPLTEIFSALIVASTPAASEIGILATRDIVLLPYQAT